ncbi:MAG: bifunctional UDP-N-acetylglucosamine diphosphorylase/glucosamine-1-phosphate N-acetyltransferase GlmU [Alphaproteobacteria bacterium]|nr:bifunctional UDP-N-acetylglucosamine diphosphorylase/glucosamine-1-phosphate N-acetyltransferase GlmU [Alphaproteobacteria bacterium]
MNAKPLAIVILAAGKGTRMKSALPKVMHALAGRPMINWLLDTASALSPQKIIVVTGPDMPMLADAVAPNQVVIQMERNGTGGAVRCALPALTGFEGDVLVLLGDTPLLSLRTLQGLLAAKQQAGISVLGARLEDPFGYGRLLMDDEHYITAIVEEKDANEAQRDIRVVNAGAFCIDGARLERWVSQIDNRNAQGEYYITDLPAIAAHEGAGTKAYITCDGDEILGCNSRSNLAALEKTLQGRLRRALMDSGVSMLDPETVYLWHDTQIAPGCLIEPNVFFGPGVRLDPDVTVRAFSHLEGAHIESGASIGPFARLRPGTIIGAGARLGNFVEVKKSTIGAGSKINHLAYVGDCKMGADVNFSCGAITVNYDGFEKHETIIGDGVMVGSNVNLVAPLSLGAGAFIAAGSTVIEDVPADSLAIERGATRKIAGWAARHRGMKRAAKGAKS